MTTWLYQLNAGNWVPCSAKGDTPSSIQRVSGCSVTYVNNAIEEDTIECNGVQLIFDDLKFTPPEYVDVHKLETRLGNIEIWHSKSQRKTYTTDEKVNYFQKCKDVKRENKNFFCFLSFSQAYDCYKNELQRWDKRNIYMCTPNPWLNERFTYEVTQEAQKGNVNILYTTPLYLNTHGLHSDERTKRLKTFIYEFV
jgi:hypothetical protein